MFVLMHNADGQTVATFGDRFRADEFIACLQRPQDYRLFQDVSTIVMPNMDAADYAERNRASIVREIGQLAETKKISAIKLYRAIYGTGLTESKRAVEEAQEDIRRGW